MNLLIASFPDLLDPSILISLVTLSFLEIILGVDNIIFISIVSNKLPEASQPRARTVGLMLALLFRIALLFGITAIIQMTNPVFTIGFIKNEGVPLGISWKDLILMAGGIFLVFKSTLEIHHKMEEAASESKAVKAPSSFMAVITQIVLVDIVFSFDSILTAVGLVDNVWVMILAVIVSMVIMMIFAGNISRFINKHPTLQILALSFLIMIGVMLVAEGFHQEINKAYIYCAIAFSLLVELLNMRIRKKHKQVRLNDDHL